MAGVLATAAAAQATTRHGSRAKVHTQSLAAMSITHITSLPQLNGILAKSNDKLSVIDFHASWYVANMGNDVCIPNA